jgi:hypothetical protein
MATGSDKLADRYQATLTIAAINQWLPASPNTAYRRRLAWSTKHRLPV